MRLFIDRQLEFDWKRWGRTIQTNLDTRPNDDEWCVLWQCRQRGICPFHLWMVPVDWVERSQEMSKWSKETALQKNSPQQTNDKPTVHSNRQQQYNKNKPTHLPSSALNLQAPSIKSKCLYREIVMVAFWWRGMSEKLLAICWVQEQTTRTTTIGAGKIETLSPPCDRTAPFRRRLIQTLYRAMDYYQWLVGGGCSLGCLRLGLQSSWLCRPDRLLLWRGTRMGQSRNSR